MNAPLLVVRQLAVEYRQPDFLRRRPPIRAVREVSFTLNAGETLGIVGESGCGKTTLGRAVLLLEQAAAGEILYDGVPVADMTAQARRKARSEMGLVFQDAAGALNPRKTALQSVAAPLVFRGIPREMARRQAQEALSATGLSAEDWGKYPHALSGGQRQRVSIARAVVSRPRLLVCDEPVSALDGTVREQILRLLKDLRQETGTALLFISHDLRAVRELCRRTAVMYLGRLVEVGETEALFSAPGHPYTQALVDSLPSPDPAAPVPPPLRGEVPSPDSPPSGCPFHPRCPKAVPRCAQERPELQIRSDGRAVACHFQNE